MEVAVVAPAGSETALATASVSQGRRSHSKPARGQPVLLMTTIGRRTNVHAPRPFSPFHSGEGFVIVAANGGAPQPPAWHANLPAIPQGARAGARAAYNGRARVAEDPSVSGHRREVTTVVLEPR